MSATSVTIGVHCSHEQHAPSALLRLARQAQSAGVTAGMCSDHFAPWLTSQGHSGFTWSWLGAALEATQLSWGTVCAPGQRYHPAIVAQAAATLAEMYPERFWLAVGSGEALNEIVTGEPWPPKHTRQQRLRECADIMRALWGGETVTHEGHVRVRNARLYSRPASPPLLIAAALTADTARWAAEWADGLITIASTRDHMRAVVDAFREAGGDRKPMFLQVALSFADTDENCRQIAWTEWRQAALPSAQLAELPTPAAFEAATRGVDVAAVLRGVRASADVERQVAWLQEDAAMGFTRIYLHNVNRDHTLFFERLVPAIGAARIQGSAT